jgi:hypothetical protein
MTILSPLGSTTTTSSSRSSTDTTTNDLASSNWIGNHAGKSVYDDHHDHQTSGIVAAGGLVGEGNNNINGNNNTINTDSIIRKYFPNRQSSFHQRRSSLSLYQSNNSHDDTTHRNDNDIPLKPILKQSNSIRNPIGAVYTSNSLSQSRNRQLRNSIIIKQDENDDNDDCEESQDQFDKRTKWLIAIFTTSVVFFVAVLVCVARM